MEIHSREQLAAFLAANDGSLSAVRLQGLRLDADDPLVGQIMTREVHGMLVLGDTFAPAIAPALSRQGALLLPSNPKVPFDPSHTVLYTPAELFAGVQDGYASTLDARCYRWSQAPDGAHDIEHNLYAALHDTVITDALGEALADAGARPVAVMGGHAMARGSDDYRHAARLGRLLADRFCVLSGGGPGAMEAVNLGAATHGADETVLDEALAVVAQVVPFDDVAAWAGAGFAARQLIDATGVRGTRSLGIPTWYYGHEPPNVFAHLVAKYFSNAIREDILLARAEALVVLPGAAGTVQEIFQATVRNYYTLGELVPTVLVGRDYWTRTLPAWPLLERLGAGRAMQRAIHLVETIDEAAAVIS
ncbi:LOG family protein [Blastococcus sp. Marseille-P5729]|uniref:LOG family protein n=1 Tax=Blastococcus sp. Marseille-P5729 TaxID=2086582 RepID=UPI0018FED6A0|nr:LOG family protein [Blastococcus sp. Marseille-P5729]